MACNDDGRVVLVTGASGYVASHIVQLLQQEGYRVRGSVRSLADDNKVEWLKNLCPDAKHALELVEADLKEAESWKRAVEDCEFVLHVASPFPLGTVANPEEEIVQPAVDGTKNVLQACAESGSVRRVIVTSSTAAIHGEPAGEDGKVYSEEDWSSAENASLEAYVRSKILAEKAAWDFVKELSDEQKFELSVINPVLVLGPVLNTSAGTSAEIVKRLMERSMPAVPKINFAICDVRDVAVAHFKAMTTPDAVDHRHIICSGNIWYKEMAQTLAKEFKSQGYNVPTLNCPYFALWLTGIVDKNIKTVLPRIGKEIKFDNNRMKTALEIEPREILSTLLDMAYSLIEQGIVKKTKKYKAHKKDGEDANIQDAEGEKGEEEDGEKKPNGEVVPEEGDEDDLKKEKKPEGGGEEIVEADAAAEAVSEAAAKDDEAEK